MSACTVVLGIDRDPTVFSYFDDGVHIRDAQVDGEGPLRSRGRSVGSHQSHRRGWLLCRPHCQCNGTQRSRAGPSLFDPAWCSVNEHRRGADELLWRDRHAILPLSAFESVPQFCACSAPPRNSTVVSTPVQRFMSQPQLHSENRSWRQQETVQDVIVIG